MKTGSLRNLEQIQEADSRPKGSRAGTLLLASLGAACVIFAIVSQAKRRVPMALRPDPLGELLAQAKGASPAQNADLAGKDVTFPSLLSDALRPTTALAAVRSTVRTASSGTPPSALPLGADSAVPPVAPGSAAPAPPPATDRLSVVPLPAKNIVASSPVVSRPRDALTQMAREASSITTPPVDEGRAGGYQLQASSFRTEGEASAFATALRQRGHRAYVEPAQLAGRGTWYRVRVGPFKTQRDAVSYRAEFENREHLVPFVVEPPKDKVKVP
ncbi:MAG TPA: SPOR domain-containing protein [Polyangiaceae bacterium]